ncbi:PVC-type heme-binding CxxCH protein [Roseiconus lacunae]|uniref:DUF1080 domain-containing protein n=1 Tax=Roseiconus lacunae TaxID=2605694 RepID=A0ABT7PF50_9BACT|nr:PVC-type heme-binding CxxCH protein [Roseiconus lacunae]MDM4014861.1 DUF1080 domain-containing protein [Roseiconus lacunae]
MTCLRRSILFYLLAAAALVSVTTRDVSAESRKIFDGRSFTDWDCDRNYWRIEDGAFVGEISPGTRLKKNTWLVWQGGELEDFELKFRFRLTGAAGANSGVQIRCQVDNVDHVSGYQADLDMGQTWLGRIYDEHGRALLVERGTRVMIDADGTRRTHTFAPKHQFQVLFRENAWNEYRIVAVGPRMDVYVNGTLFSQLSDIEDGEHDLRGKLAFQLHSGGETKIEFKQIELETLGSGATDRLTKFTLPKPVTKQTPKGTGDQPKSEDGATLDFDFESGNLDGWQSTGDAFVGQPVDRDGISDRWREQSSNKSGEFFIGGFELKGDRAKGSLTSPSFRISKPFASFLIGGGESDATRVEIVAADNSGQVLFKATGDNREQMRRVVADLSKHQNVLVKLRLVDEHASGWGHLNFDDFRFHDTPPVPVEPSHAWRSKLNPLLHHLVENQPSDRSAGKDRSHVISTVNQMHVPEGFSVDVVAAEPEVHQPIAFTFDNRGRLWVVEGHSYPQKRAEGEGLDKIVILEDADADGRYETRKVFIEGLNLVSGIEVGHGGVWIGAAPELLFIADHDGDDIPDASPKVMLDGFGYGDTHETLNSLLWGPDGWLYGNQGVFNTSMIGKPGSKDEQRQHLAAGVWRFHPTRHEFEVFAHGGSNQWGLDYDQHGQLFMTHCRSHWGQGATTHVMRNGHYWNQINGGYAPYISSVALPGMPHLKNYLLASARYGHGEGGAGKRGSREVYGGHSHVGTMIYLGDNWPESYRNHLFTLNLHGHQINHQVNEREFGGYNTVHAGTDVLLCDDPQFVGVDLKVGPDGAVYVSDWYDPRHCHNPNSELWDRGNGRLYRMQYEASYQPRNVDYAKADGAELVAALTHRNHWHARAARMTLAERATTDSIDSMTIASIRKLLTSADEVVRLQACWALHVIGQTDQQLINYLLQDKSEYVRAWAIQLGCQSLNPEVIGGLLSRHCAKNESLFVRRYLASAVPDVDNTSAWLIASYLMEQEDTITDRDLPVLIWQMFAPLLDQDVSRGLDLARKSAVRSIFDNSLWYAARTSTVGREVLVAELATADEDRQRDLVVLFAHALSGMRGVEAPKGWDQVASLLYQSPLDQVRGAAEQVGAAFADPILFKRLRSIVIDRAADEHIRRRAIQLLEADPGKDNLDAMVALLDEPAFAATALPLLARYDDPNIATKVLQLYLKWSPDAQNAAMELLASRPEWANRLLDEVAAGTIEKSQLTAYFANQMANLGDDQLTQRLSKEWGRLGGSSAELRDEIRKTINAYNAAPKWAFSQQQGAAHFKKLCAACHQPGEQSARIAPKLEGTRTKGIEYAVENVIDPNAVIGEDFQARVILTSDGQVVSGLIQSETDTAITVKTATSVVTIDQDEVERIKVSKNSFMPSGLLNTLNERERIELFKYIMSL